jgi:hypothetical protein
MQENVDMLLIAETHQVFREDHIFKEDVQKAAEQGLQKQLEYIREFKPDKIFLELSSIDLYEFAKGTSPYNIFMIRWMREISQIAYDIGARIVPMENHLLRGYFESAQRKVDFAKKENIKDDSEKVLSYFEMRREKYWGDVVSNNLHPGERGLAIYGEQHANKDNMLIKRLEEEGRSYIEKMTGTEFKRLLEKYKGF